MTKRKGSAMIFAVVLVASMGAAILATGVLTAAALKDGRRIEDQARMRHAFEGAAEQAAADYTKGTLTTFPTTRSATIGSVPMSITITDNSAVTPRTMLVTGTCTLHGNSSTYTKVLGMRKAPSPFFYAMFVNNGISTAFTFNTGSSGTKGDVFASGNISLGLLLGTVNGSLESTGSISTGLVTVTGPLKANAAAITYPTVLNTNYSSVANVTRSQSSLNGFNFPSTANEYYLVYCTGNTSISGTFTGKGTIFVNGTASISGAMSYANSSSRVAIIASGGITVGAAGLNAVGYLYSGSTFTIPVTGLTITRGSIATNNINLGGAVNVVLDDAVWLNSAEGTKHRLPGFYP